MDKKYIIAVSSDLYDDIFADLSKNCILIKNKNFINKDYLSNLKPEYIFFPHWSYIIPKEIYENFECVIFHMTDLPFGRGGSPLQNLISRGIYKTKISAIKCAKELDSGDIYLKKDLSLDGAAHEIYKRAGGIIFDMIGEIIETKPIPQKQDGEIVEFERKRPEESNIENLGELTKIYDYIRMLDADGYPKVFLEFGNFRIEFSKASFIDSELKASVIIKDKDK